MTNVNLKKIGIMSRSKGQVPTERFYHRECSCELLKALAFTIQMLLIRLKYSKVGQTQRSRSQGQNCCFPWNGSVTINTHVKYQSSGTHYSNIINKVKVF